MNWYAYTQRYCTSSHPIKKRQRISLSSKRRYISSSLLLYTQFLSPRYITIYQSLSVLIFPQLGANLFISFFLASSVSSSGLTLSTFKCITLIHYEAKTIEIEAMS
ncbi:hypothetical protein SSX86_030161 [Deinandra increscens subsp. villosa]|uniref:Uncharacterized protein n=1 Tax=Deinandra increscens subsp. villosa TaxID=3103831 RepID=A0AAP0C5Y7_9ASTR